MMEDLENLDKIINENDLKSSDVKSLLSKFLMSHVKASHINSYIGDFPTFIEPVHLGENVKIGDDVLLGPNVYVGNNCELGDYNEISNSIILDNVKLGNNFTLERCIIAKNSTLNFDNLNLKNCVLKGTTDSKKGMKKILF